MTLPSALDVAMARAEVHPIPPITDPLGRSWRQPDRKRIDLDDSHALMSQATFAALADYSATMPTGVYPGKMWKRHNGAYDRAFLAAGGKPEWVLVWYGFCEDPGKCSINFRTILIADAAKRSILAHKEKSEAGRIGPWERGE